MTAFKLDTLIEEDGIIRVPEVKAGDRVEVIVLRQDPVTDSPAQPFAGWLKGKIKIHPEFDDPIPGMEDYL